MSKKRKQAERAARRRSGAEGAQGHRLETGATPRADDTPRAGTPQDPTRKPVEATQTHAGETGKPVQSGTGRAQSDTLSRKGKENPRPPRDAGWVSGKRPVFRFVGTFVLLMALFYGLTFVPLLSKRVLPYYMQLNARASAGILNVLGEGASAKGTAVISPRYSVDIRHGCDAIEPSALFIAAVLAFPGPWRSKLPGLLAGTVVLAIINLVRIVTLFYTGIYKPRWFEAMHVDVWQPVFILLALTLWVLWALWATRGGVSRAHAAR